MKVSKITMKNIFIIILLISMTFNIVLFGEILKTKKQSNAVINEYTEKQKELDTKLNANDKEQEKVFDKYYSEKLKKFMNEEDLMFLAQRQYDYLLSVNGEAFRENTLYTDNKNIKIVLAEFQSAEKILPDDILIKGNVTGGDPNDSFGSHLNVTSLAKYNQYKEEDANVKRVCYEFKDIQAGTIITLKLSEMLMNRLNLKDNILEIIVR